jgi:maleylpyruvate isomerase
VPDDSGPVSPGDREIERDVASTASSHAALGAWLHGLEPVDPATPSLLPEWTIGHVLTHIARNAESHLAMLAGRPQYPSRAARDADIAAGAARPWGELVADVVGTAGSLDEAFAAVGDWGRTVTTVTGERPAAMLPLLRQREVEVHRADLGMGYGFDDMPADYVRRDLRVMEMLWKADKPMGLTPLPAAALATLPTRRLAWLMGRADIDDIGPAGIF